MVIPIEQTCPKCGSRFLGSDVLGEPCWPCQGFTGFPFKIDPSLPDDVIEFRHPDGRIDRSELPDKEPK